jgi:hypothetical protein
VKALSLYHQQIVLLKRERIKLDSDIAQILAEAVLDGHNIQDVLDHYDDAILSSKQESFDL